MRSGQITICKVYKDGRKEVVLDKSNLITIGLGASLSDMLGGYGTENSIDYSPLYFQMGTSYIDFDETAITTSAEFYRLSAPFDWPDYGDDTEINVEKAYRCFAASTDDGGVSYSEMLLASAVYSSIIYSGIDEYFGVIGHYNVTKFFLDAVESEIVLDEKSGNGKSISEIGLYLKNPRGLKEDSPLLVAYKKFDAIDKNSDYSIVIHWNIGFLGISPTVDNVYTGGHTPGQDLPSSGYTTGGPFYGDDTPGGPGDGQSGGSYS